MQFIIRNIQANLSSYRAKILRNARIIILFHKQTAGETKLNNYLLDNYKLDLKNACLHLLANCKIYRNYNKEMIILFPKKADDELAALITYGTAQIKGSNLLKDAFFRD